MRAGRACTATVISVADRRTGSRRKTRTAAGTWVPVDPEERAWGPRSRPTTSEVRSPPEKRIDISSADLLRGGELFRSLLEAGVVDSVEVAIIPILLGGGIPLLPDPARTRKLKLASHKVYGSTGIVSLKYDVM